MRIIFELDHKQLGTILNALSGIEGQLEQIRTLLGTADIDPQAIDALTEKLKESHAALDAVVTAVGAAEA